MLRRRVSGAWHKDSKVEKGRRMRRPFFSSARAMRGVAVIAGVGRSPCSKVLSFAPICY